MFFEVTTMAKSAGAVADAVHSKIADMTGDLCKTNPSDPRCAKARAELVLNWDVLNCCLSVCVLAFQP